MEAKHVFKLFDSHITPVFNYASEMWLPYVMQSKCFKSTDSLIGFWENFIGEKINQKCCRILLSVHRKCSRLATLGDLGRYPVFLTSLSQCLKYKYFLQTEASPESLVSHAMTEMTTMTVQSQDCWLYRVRNIESLLGLPDIKSKKTLPKQYITKYIRGKFYRFWLDQVNKEKIGTDGQDHKKLCTYKTFKGSFTPEPYIDFVKNRNQRKYLSRFRLSAHCLDIERLRYKNIPLSERICRFCSHTNDNKKSLDDEFHFFQCEKFIDKINCLKMKMNQLHPGFLNYDFINQFRLLMCPTTPQSTKVTNKFIKIIFEARDKIDKGLQPNDIFLNF